MIAIILLAAGNSRRFQKNKLLYEIDGKPMFLHTYEKAVLLAEKYKDIVSNLFVVTRYEEMRDMVRNESELIWNHKPEYGISHSIHLGIEATGIHDDYFFMVCDMPSLSIVSLEGLMNAYLKSGRLSCLGSEDHYGNPAIFPNRYRESLLDLRGDMGGKCILKKEEETLLLLFVPQEELVDIDDQKSLTE